MLWDHPCMPTVRASALEATNAKDADVLRSLSTHRSMSVRYAVADNPATDDETIARLIDDPNESVRYTAASNLAERPALQQLVARSSDEWLRAALASTFLDQDDRSLPRDVQRALMADTFAETRSRIAETTNYLDIFETLLHDSDDRVSAACAANPRIEREQMERLITDPKWEVRASAAARGMRYPDDEQLLRLAQDRSVGVRWTVVYRPDRPRAALELIAKDDDEMNAHAAKSVLGDDDINSAQVRDSAREQRARAEGTLGFQG
ncbi:hypothetical protein C5C13_11685 [Clavibacter michiganensis]|nr:hypothetical protein C5C13_11685 [Clavibacter michiganensis]